MEENKSSASKTGKVLRIIGIVILVIGSIIDLIAFINFGLTDTNVSDASLLYLFWIGSPIISIGGIILFFAHIKNLKNEEIDTFIKCDCCKPIHLDENKLVECPQCKSNNNRDAKFCNKCGTRLKWY